MFIEMYLFLSNVCNVVLKWAFAKTNTDSDQESVESDSTSESDDEYQRK